jgi:excisionase family DNA binding protein
VAIRSVTVGAGSDAVVPRLALSPDEAAEALSMSRDFFDEHVKPELRIVRRGRKVLVSVRELERWLEASSARTLERP